LLWTDGHDFPGKTVVQRHAELERIITPVSRIQVGGYVEVAGMRGLEWIIAKSKSSICRPGKTLAGSIEIILHRWTRSRIGHFPVKNDDIVSRNRILPPGFKRFETDLCLTSLQN
jgi:hypothetical protein